MHSNNIIMWFNNIALAEEILTIISFQQLCKKSDKTHTCMTAIKNYTTWISDSSRSFHASFIRLITSSSSLCCFLREVAKLPTTLATCKHSFLGLANQAITYLLPQIAATSFSLWPFFLRIPEAFNSSRIPTSFSYMATSYDHAPIQKGVSRFHVSGVSIWVTLDSLYPRNLKQESSVS